MKIHEIIEQDPMFKRYAGKYSRPLFKYSNPATLPEKYFKAFIVQADITEIALYYLGYANKRYDDIPSILAFLYRHHGFKIPVIDGILTEKYWLDWVCTNYTEIERQRAEFN